MKEYVSLLPSWYQQEQKQLAKLSKARRVLTMVLLAFVAVLVVTSAAGLLQNARLSALKHQNAQIQQQMTALAQYKGIYEELTTLKGYEAAVVKGDQEWLGAINEIAKALPGGVWIDSLTTEQQADGVRTLKLQCAGNLHSDISRAITLLQNSNMVTSVYCPESSENDGSVQFTLAVTLAASK